MHFDMSRCLACRALCQPEKEANRHMRLCSHSDGGYDMLYQSVSRRSHGHSMASTDAIGMRILYPEV
jgi:hypothetical protein